MNLDTTQSKIYLLKSRSNKILKEIDILLSNLEINHANDATIRQFSIAEEKLREAFNYLLNISG